MLTKLRLIFMATLVSLCLVSSLSGCTTNPYTGQQQASRTAMGTGIGAAGGALIGQLIGGNTQSTLIGAGIGALAGGAVGGYMDHQASELRAQLRGTGVSVVKEGNNIRLIMPGDITFAFNRADINSSFYPVLNSVALVLKKYNKTWVRVAGYTDNIGSASYNQKLSENRAQNVANYLASQGVAPNRFSVVGYGARYPVANNSTSQGRALNRRVVITLQPIS